MRATLSVVNDHIQWTFSRPFVTLLEFGVTLLKFEKIKTMVAKFRFLVGFFGTKIRRFRVRIKKIHLFEIRYKS